MTERYIPIFLQKKADMIGLTIYRLFVSMMQFGNDPRILKKGEKKMKAYTGYNDRTDTHYFADFKIVDDLPESDDPGFISLKPVTLDCEQGDDDVYNYECYRYEYLVNPEESEEEGCREIEYLAKRIVLPHESLITIVRKNGRKNRNVEYRVEDLCNMIDWNDLDRKVLDDLTGHDLINRIGNHFGVNAEGLDEEEFVEFTLDPSELQNDPSRKI